MMRVAIVHTALHEGCARWRLLRRGQCRVSTRVMAGDRLLARINKRKSLPSESAANFFQSERNRERRLVAYSSGLRQVFTARHRKIRDNNVLVWQSRGYQTCIQIKKKEICYVRASWIDPRDKPCMREKLMIRKGDVCVHVESNMDSNSGDYGKS